MNELEKEILQLINERYPLNFINIKPITNEMYQCLTELGSYFIRITNYKKYEEQLEEVAYTNFLYENGLAVPPIIHSLNGKLVEKLTLDKEIFEYSLMHMYWDKEELTEDQVRIMNLYRMKIENKYTYINV
ncbi:HAD family hydrolase [Bacillus wiedmannii]|uniref:Aminoglycoside phosphotransferase n=1 Tax=Bacillus wiedmannii TaxID=1890302 RepID=A0A2C4PYE3_9BACI|nr:hypothetical protein [Bacillus wiedmannii]MCU5098207.1 hypothetical protein [Bacillus wiedmannii]PHD57559.1 hypothetical protein COF57_22985 [Bacillus wiedmannii]PRT05020.1 hypothetical protein C6356_18430 [Bacillus wiedmannii]PRT39631.1 hypothetical protein C6357_13190 [Bacillus wiedmannii]